MAEFNVGDSVIYIKTEDKGIVKVIHPEIDGKQQYTVQFPSGVHIPDYIRSPFPVISVHFNRLQS